jgi:hypothetical protein
MLYFLFLQLVNASYVCRYICRNMEKLNLALDVVSPLILYKIVDKHFLTLSENFPLKGNHNFPMHADPLY